MRRSSMRRRGCDVAPTTRTGKDLVAFDAGDFGALARFGPHWQMADVVAAIEADAVADTQESHKALRSVLTDERLRTRSYDTSGGPGRSTVTLSADAFDDLYRAALVIEESSR